MNTADERVTIRGQHNARAPFEFQGYVVPETDGLLAVDERYPGVPDDEDDPGALWAITHLPTSFRVSHHPHTDDCSTKEAAFAMAQRFYRAARERGWDLRSTEPVVLTNAHNSMSADEKAAFWSAVQGSQP